MTYSQPTILVVDDDADIVAVVCMALERCGFATDRAYDGEEAAAMLKDTPYALVVADLRMPFAGGLELCAQMRAEPETARIPFVLLTASWMDAAPPDLSGPGAVLSKPFSPSALVDTVAGLLGGGNAKGVAA